MLFVRRSNSGSRRALFLAGVSLVAMAASSGASARPFGYSSISTAATAAATSAAQDAAQQAQQTALNAQQSMARATRAIQALQAAQSAARALAAGTPSSVPNGLNAGGLVPDSGLKAPGVANPVTTWIGANTPTQTTSGGQTTVNIDQTQQTALLNWQTFNVGAGTTVNFNQQGNASWVALNKIAPNVAPSQILGSIKAAGSVYLINQNGIIFGGTSQVNVHTLIASTLNLGIPDQTFLQNGLFSSDVPSVNDFAGNAIKGSHAALFSQAQTGPTDAKIIVQRGAIIDTTGKVTSTGDGGFVALLGSGGVSNAGSIITQNGQIILAANSAVDAKGNSIALITPLAGLVGTKTAMQVLAGGGVVTNEAGGLLVANDGAVTLSGGSINQLGGIVATTSTTRTGSILLSTACLNSACAAVDGNIVLGAASLTAILPDETSTTLPTSTANSTTTANGANNAAYFQTVLQPTITIQASGSVDVQGSADGSDGALIKAPSAALSISTRNSSTGTVLLEQGSTIDLSGIAGVTLPMSINEVTFKVTAAEVADTPLAQGLIGQTVTIDTRLSGTRADGFHWVGSPILDAAGYAGLIPQSIDQILVAGGSFTTSAANVIQKPGAVINVSAGYVQYTGGLITTTRVLGANGRIYDIGSADPTISYLAVASGFTVLHKVNGNVDPSLTQVYLSPLGGSGGHYEQGYISGANAGAINVTAVAPILAGEIVADVVAGNRQRAGIDPMPTGASLGITFVNSTLTKYNVVLEPQADAGPDPYGLSGFSFANASTWVPALINGVFPVFSDILSNASLNAVSVKGAYQLSMPADAALVVRPGGSITFDGVTSIDGVLSAPSGRISLTGFTYAENKPEQPPVPALVIGSDAVLDVHGLWVNDTGLLPDQIQGAAFVNGGSVRINTFLASDGPGGGEGAFKDATQSIVLLSGSVIDVSGGGYVATTGTLKTGSDGLPVGKGGSVALVTYDFPSVTPPSRGEGTNPFNVVPHGTNADGSVNYPNQANVLLGGTIYAGGFDGGGTLTLQVPTVVIDAAAGKVTSNLSGATAAALSGQSGAPLAGSAVSDGKVGQLVLPPSFFRGGFSQYVLTDIYGGTTVTAGTQVVMQQTNALPTGNVAQIPTGTLVSSFASVGLLPDGLRQPASLTLNGTNVLLDHGSGIVVDPQGTITLNAVATANILGDVVAHAGTISVSGTAVQIGATAVLDVSGTFVPNPLVTTYSTGTVLGGGTITLTALGGNLVAEPGAQFDLQGAAVTAQSNLIQLPQGGLAPQFVGQAAWSNGGNLQLLGTNIYFAGAVDAAGGAPLASGGSLTIGAIVSTATLPTPTTIVVEQGGFVAANLSALSSTSTPGAFIGADTLSNSGFDSVTLNAGTIKFAGSLDVRIPGALTLDASSGHFSLTDASNVTLNAGYVRMVGVGPGVLVGGLTAPSAGTGTLNVTAQWIDLQRAIALDNVGNADFTSAGAVRLLPDTYGFTSSNTDGRSTFAGALVVPGNLTLRAGEIYPVSNTDFLLMSTGTLPSTGTITIAQNGQPTAPLSAGGSMVFSAQTIVQGGTLWAPLGSIVLGVRDSSDIPTQFTSAVAPLFGNTTFAPGLFTPTQSVTLGEGGLTSVSAAGLVIPDGLTVDGTTWYQGAPLDSLPAVLSAPPSKSISLFGTNVATQPGAKLDLSGGGDIYATEYVAGTGGTRNVLTTYQQDPTTGALTPTYADGRQVYALVPSYEAKVAAYDPNFAYAPYYSGVVVPSGSSTQPYANAITPGQTVTIAAGSGIPAGTYTLLSGMYATLPGAYRVVQVAGNVNPATPSFASPDGSQYVTGTLGNALTGTQSSQSALFQLQSKAVWSTYSRIDITSGTRFFRNQAIAAGKAPPPLPIDGGVLLLGAINSLNLAGTNLFGPGTSDLAPGLVGGGGQVQIGGGNILVLASDKTVPAGVCVGGSAAGCTDATNYLVLDADQISGLGASSVLIGGTATVVNGVENITATALNLEILTDDAHKLTGPELLLVSLGGSGRGVVVDAGSVVQAVGTVPGGTDRDIIFGANPVAQYNSDGTLKGYTAGITGDGALLRVSNGTVVNVTRFFVPGQYTGPGPLPSSPTPQGAFSVGAGASIDGGNALTLDTSGSGTLASDATLKARNYDIAGSVINVGGGASGVVLSTQVLGNFNDAVSVRLRSASVINLYDANGLQIGDAAHPIGTLTFDSAGLYNAGLDSTGHYVPGGSTTVYATNITLANSRGVTGTGMTGAGGTLTLNASGTITEDVGAKRLGGFGQINFNAGQAIAFSGAGSLDSGPVATATASLGVAGIAVTAGGSGYSNGDQVTVSGSDGNGNTVVATGAAIVDAGGAIIGVNITAAGSGFAGPVTSVAVSSASGGSGATLAASLGVVGVSLVNAGDGYTGNPTLSFTGGGGTGATATASVSSGVVSGLTLANGGSGYTSIPTVLISGGGGGAANMNLSAPVVLVNRGATQSLATGGSVTLVTGAGTAPAGVATNIGGALTVTAASITDTATIRALSGNVSLTATAGDVMLGAGAVLDASGSRITIGDVFQDAPGGNVQLTSTTGDVKIDAGAAVSVAGAGIGYAGSLSILAAKNATLDGTLDGHAAFKDTGGRFTLQAGSESGALPLSSGFTGGFAVQLGRGDITIGAGQTLASGNVLLVANTGRVIVEGTIDASGPGGGTIALYGAGAAVSVTDINGQTYADVDGGVSIGANARLLARYQVVDPSDPGYANGTSALVQKGGTITLGTTGTPDTTANGATVPDATYGYQTISGQVIKLADGTEKTVSKAGKITVDAGAVLDVSGGPGGTSIDNTGGSVIVRAPILNITDNVTNPGTTLNFRNVNVSFNGTVVVVGVVDAGGKPSGNGVVLNAYAVWSTTDGSTGAQHFDGIVDPAGWYGADGKLVAGTFTDAQGHTIAYAPGDGTTDAQLKAMLTSDLFTPTAGATNADHTGFYGYVDPNTGKAAGTLPLFVQNFNLTNTPISGSIANVHLRPEIDLINPSSTVNSGNITVASNWNLGAGSADSSGNVTLYYRTASGGEPGTLALRAVNNVNINATISDGFFLQYRNSPLPVVVPAQPGSMPPTATYWYDQELAALAGYAGTDHDYNNYIDANGNLTFGGPTFDQMFGNGSYIPYSLLGPVKLQAPMVFSNPQNDPTTAKLIDQYIQYYYQYTQLFDVYAKSTAFNEGFYGPPPSGQSPYLPPAAPTTPDNYYNFLTGAQPGSGTDYVSQYQNYYLQVLVNVNAGSAAGGFATAYRSANCGPCVANAAPFAPMEVLASSVQPGYSPSVPVVTTIPAHLAGPVTADMIATVYAQAMDAISNNPLVTNLDPLYGIGNIMNATSATPLMTAAVSGKGSFSYNFVAGAAFTNNTLSVDPNAVVPVSSLSPTVTGNVTVDGHTSYPDVLPAQGFSLTINIPTLVRTGTGSITIAAAGNVELLDQVTPGAIYTAGAAVAATPPNFNAPTLPAKYTATPNGLVSTPAWATGGGAVTVTAGGSIIGIEMPTDSDGSQTGVIGATTGQLWSDWYIHYGKSNGLADGKTAPFSDCAAAGSVACQTAAWINYATFFQAFGALGGGNITLKAGADIIDVGASLPETLVVSGGTGALDQNGKLIVPTATYYGGGNLSVTAGGNLLSSDFLVGRGSGLIQVGGVVQATTSNPLNRGKPTIGVNASTLSTYPLPLLLAVQDGFIALAARGSVTLGNVYDPASLPLNTAVQTNVKALPGVDSFGSNSIWSNLFTSYGPDSGISLTSITGDVTALTISPSSIAGLFVHNAGVTPNLGLKSDTIGLLLPATLDLAALSGGITINKTGQPDIGNASLLPYPTQTGNDTGTVSLVAAGSIDLGAGLAMPDLLTATTQYISARFDPTYTGNYISPLGVPLANLTMALHANDSAPVIIAAGQDIYAVDPDTNLAASLTLIKPARIEAGNNIYAAIAKGGGLATTGSGPQGKAFTFLGQNNNPGDITSIVAGNDLVGGSYALYGSGTFVLQAGHDLGPFRASVKDTETWGVASLGNGSAAGSTFTASGGQLLSKPYLPAQGAEIDLLFGVKPGIDYAAAIAQYVDPVHAGTGGIDFLTDIASILGQPRDQAWTTFQGLSPARQQLLVNRAFLDFVIQVGKDYKDPASPYFAQYARAYTAISTLFPPGSGYTDNATGGGNGAAVKIPTGKLNIAASVLETQMGGDINILGPGGGITVGHTSLDTLNPNQEGILTLGGGTIRAFTDDSILVNQSRIMTQQGGDIGLFVANGDINAGSGPKTYASSPSVSEICTTYGYCYTNPQGLVTGAGIAALVTLPGQDPTKSNVTLIAPRGTIDVSTAGIRGNDITLVALQVLNAFNITATGTVTGLAFTPPPNVALATTTNVTAATQQSGLPAQTAGKEQPSIIIVEVVGYGGSGDDTGAGDDDERRRRGQGQ